MSSVEYEQWLYRSDSGRDEPVVVSEGNDMGREEDGGLPKDYEAVSSWFEYSKSKTWLMETARVSDQASTQSAVPREHQVAISRGEMNKWLVRPTADALSGQLEAKLCISSEHTPWLMSCAPSDDKHTIIGHFCAVLSTPNTQWLCKRRPSELDKWLFEPKKPRLSPTTSFDPLLNWKTFQENIDWNPSVFHMQHESVFGGSGATPENTAGGEEGKHLTCTSVEPTSLPLPCSRQEQRDDSIEQWLLPSAVHPRSFSSLPLFEPANPLEGAYSLDQWLPSSRPQPSFDAESEASLISLGSEYELIDKL